MIGYLYLFLLFLVELVCFVGFIQLFLYFVKKIKMWNSELLSSESISITADAYIEWLQMKYDFYGNLIWVGFLIF